MADGARTIGSLLAIEPGCSAWSSTRRGHNDLPLGGVVVEKGHREPVVDPDTGEVVQPGGRTFVCLDPSRRIEDAREDLFEAEIALDGVEPPATSTISGLIHNLHGEAYRRHQGSGRRPKSKLRDSRDAEIARWIYVLTGVVFGGQG